MIAKEFMTTKHKQVNKSNIDLIRFRLTSVLKTNAVPTGEHLESKERLSLPF